MRRMPWAWLPTALVAALALARRVDAAGEGLQPGSVGVADHAAVAGGAVIIGREDLVRVRAALGRIGDELHLILGVLDQQLAAPPVVLPAATAPAAPPDAAQPEVFVPLPREEPSSEAPPRELPLKPAVSIIGPWTWAMAEWLFWGTICMLDIGIVVGMQLFLESIGRKRGGSSIMPKRNVAKEIATKAAGAPGPGAPIPAPTATPGRASSQRLSVLSQEELLAAVLTEHWGKLAVGVGLTVACRLPQWVLPGDGLVCHMLTNLTVMLRCMSLVMLLVRDDMTIPRKERPDRAAAAPAPPVPPRRRAGGETSG